MKQLFALRKVLSKPAYAAAFLVVTALLFFVYAYTANVLVWGTLQFNPLGFSYATVALLLLLAAGTGLLAAVGLHARKFKAKTCAAGIAGGSVGFVSSACVYCPPVLAFVFGAQGLFFLSQYGAWLALAAVALVYYGLNESLKVV